MQRWYDIIKVKGEKNMVSVTFDKIQCLFMIKTLLLNS